MKSKLLMLVVSALLLIPGLSSATGTYCTGFVSVNVAGGTTSIIGTPNVRWNAVALPFGTEYIYVAGEAGNLMPVTIGARDGDNGNFGFCIVSPGNPYYPDAQHLRRQNGDGTLIYATKGSATQGSNECTFLYTQNHSCLLH